MINTSKGAKTPIEALKIFQMAKVPAGDLLGIIRQLLKDHPEQAAEAIAHVGNHPDSYSSKIQTMAKEWATGLPVGAKVIRNGEDVRRALGNLDLGSSVPITFAKDAGRRLEDVLVMDRIIRLDENARMFMTHCVIPSGRWEGIPRTHQATIYISSPADMEMCEHYLPGVVEKIELICTRKQFVAANAG